MASTTKTTRLLVLLQIALFLFSAVILLSSSVCHGARDGGHAVMKAATAYYYGVLDPNRPACNGFPCRQRVKPYTGRPYTRQPPNGGETPPPQH